MFRQASVVSILLCLAFATVSCTRADNSAMPICAIDMGSNSFRRIAGSFDGQYRERSIEVRTLGVGDDVSRHGGISDGKMAEIEQTLSAFRTACEGEGARTILAIGTAAFREAPNGPAVVAKARALGIQMEIATEQRESELAYLVGSLGDANVAVIDNGSRSIELVAEADGAIRHHVFNLGYRVAFERYFAAAEDPAAAIAAFRTALAAEAAQAPFMTGRRKLVGIEFREMVDVLFGGGETEGRVLASEALRRRLTEIEMLDPGEFQRLKATKDVDRALPRLVVAQFLVDTFGYAQLELTRRELGTGLIIEAGRRSS